MRFKEATRKSFSSTAKLRVRFWNPTTSVELMVAWKVIPMSSRSSFGFRVLPNWSLATIFISLAWPASTASGTSKVEFPQDMVAALYLRLFSFGMETGKMALSHSSW